MPTLWLAVLLLAANAVGAADGDLDPSFGTGGKVMTTLADHAAAADVAIHDDGKIVVVATVQSNDPLVAPAMAVVRYLPSGALDTSFAGVGYVTAQVDTFGGGGRAVAIQPDGRILALGQTQAVTHGAGIMFLKRYDADGTPDATFGVGGMVQFPALVAAAGDVAPTTDDKILVTELVATASFTTETRVRRLQADGTPDSSFGTAGSVAVPLTNFSVAPEMAFRADGAIVLGSAQIVAISPAILSAFAASRLLPAGAVDTSFGTGGVSPAFGDAQYVPGAANGIALQSDERLVLAGATGAGFALVGMGADGGADATFGTGGVFTDGFAPSANAIAAVGGDKFVAAGGGGAAFALARVTGSGALDATFGTGGKVLTAFGDSFASANGLAVQDDDAIVAVGTTGSASGSRIALARYLVTLPCADADDDGLCDVDDECPAGALFASARLNAIDAPGMVCDDRIALNGVFDAPVTPIDPATTGLRAVVRNGIGEAVIDDTLPAGAYDGATRTGWRVRTRSGGTTWSFSRPADAGPVSRAAVQQRASAPGVLKIRVKGTNACFAAPVSSLPLGAAVVLTPPQAVDGQCGEARFPGAPEAACESRAGGARIVCR